MLYLLNWRLWVALAIVGALTASHVIAYRKGASHVRLEWQAAVARANSEARSLEQARQSAVDAAQRIAAAREARLRADAGRAADALRGLRDDLLSARHTPAQSCTAEAERADTLGKLLLESGEALADLAAKADRHASDVRTLLDAWPK